MMLKELVARGYHFRGKAEYTSFEIHFEYIQSTRLLIGAFRTPCNRRGLYVEENFQSLCVGPSLTRHTRNFKVRLAPKFGVMHLGTSLDALVPGTAAEDNFSLFIFILRLLETQLYHLE